ncbi:uncharacterized protein F5891DRAFT_1170059 [Suillus fuscotomentosus]|uniref:Uncharacterized protein n=1 Tax=Suillus fuscotomentosus TaxID=1912939 RepID=A0AAD4HQX7_9AGAM|nr:uncharacterized protein F5891DRAFT_1170059 [Suillus fuscotomentosus]KAG1905713.1 hypothetical protein F5891DRAFT_1170059 [Suillus fuscotomentosus]
MNLLSTTSEELRHLTCYCRAQSPTANNSRFTPAQLNAIEIATTFDAEHCRLTEAIRSELLEGGNSKRPLQLLVQHLKTYDAECHETFSPVFPTTQEGSTSHPNLLDVYLHEYQLIKSHEEERMFSLSHDEFCDVFGLSSAVVHRIESTNPCTNKAIPKGFATVLVVFPTDIEGGALLLRQGHHEWTIDFAELFARTTQTSVAFIAFYDDVQFAVRKIKSGHRVILTYRLHFPTDNDIPLTTLERKGVYDVNSLTTGITELLLDPSVLPEGGYLAFGLHNQYMSTSRSVVDIGSHLKGRDAMIACVLNSLSILWSVRILYRNVGWTDFSFLADHIVDLSSHDEVHCLSETLGNPEIVRFVGARGEPDRRRAKSDGDVMGGKDATDIMLVSTRPSAWSFHSHYVAGGREVMMGNLYGDVCIIAERPSLVMIRGERNQRWRAR